MWNVFAPAAAALLLTLAACGSGGNLRSVSDYTAPAAPPIRHPFYDPTAAYGDARATWRPPVVDLNGGLVRPRAEETSWRAMFIAGLLIGGVVLLLFRPASFGATPVSLPLAIVAGVFVGFGTRLGSGCTSGHGVCGLSRFSGRSLAATMTFMATGAMAAFVVQHLVRGAR